ncbi:MAG: hypothetical protein IGQ45_04490 [Cyanobacterium sp. T60_A2020_053]|nr:hypothetical protein [Cyanobacterium sp. T60_A2020_053]
MARKKTKTSTGLSNPKSKVNVTLTEEANNTLNAIAKGLGMSKSGLFEQILVGDIAIFGKNAEKQVSLIDNPNEEGSFFDGVQDFNGDNLVSSSPTNDNQEYLTKIQNLEEIINSQRDTVAEKLKINHNLQEELETKNILIKSLQDDLLKIDNEQKSVVDVKEFNDLHNELLSLKNELTAKENQLSSLHNDLENNNQKLSSLQDNFSSLNIQLTEKGNQINVLQKELETQQNLVTQQENKIKELSDNSALHLNKVNKLQQQLIEKEEQINVLEKEVENQQQLIIQRENKIKELSDNSALQIEKIDNLQQQLKEKEKKVSQLTQEINNFKNNLEEVKNQTALNQEKLQKQINEYQLKINEKEQEKIALSQNLAKERRALEDNLLAENQQQKHLINNLYSRISELELYASFGEKMLNKWRK